MWPRGHEILLGPLSLKNHLFSFFRLFLSPPSPFFLLYAPCRRQFGHCYSIRRARIVKTNVVAEFNRFRFAAHIQIPHLVHVPLPATPIFMSSHTTLIKLCLKWIGGVNLFLNVGTITRVVSARSLGPRKGENSASVAISSAVMPGYPISIMVLSSILGFFS